MPVFAWASIAVLTGRPSTVCVAATTVKPSGRPIASFARGNLLRLIHDEKHRCFVALQPAAFCPSLERRENMRLQQG